MASALVLFVPGLARAQITVATPTSLPRTDANGKEIQKRDQQYKPEGISYQDCLDGQGVRFSLTLAAVETNASLEAWATVGGTDCSAQTARTGNSAVCWRVTKGIPLSTNPIVILPVRKLIGGRSNSGASEEGRDDVGVCGSVPLTNITLQFLYFKPGDLAQAAFKADVPIQANTIGPVAPTGMKVLPGNTRLSISFNALGEGGVVELSTIRAYCDPEPGGAVTTCDDASAGDGDADAADANCTTTAAPTSPDGGDAGFTCSSAAFTGSDGKAIQPDSTFNGKYECGSLAASSTGSVVIARSLRGAPLLNNHIYAVALAATDSFLNVGTLSQVVCEYPEETQDFWADYKKNGGGAGGGFCSIDGAGMPAGSFAVIGLAMALGIGTIRRLVKRKEK